MKYSWVFIFYWTVALYAANNIQSTEAATEYFGRYIGPLSRLLHSVSGEVYAVDARTLHIRDFTYDGEGPAAFFYAGSGKAPGVGGFVVRDESGSNGVLKRYNKKHITLTLPEGKTLNNIRWFSVWCDEFQVNFGDIQIPRGLDFPKPQKVGALSGVHGVSSDNIVVVDAQTLLIPSFSYDGEAPDAKFWVGRGPKPSPQGIRVPDENGKQTPLRRYDHKTIVLTLPSELTIFDIGHFGVWCEAFTVDFGHVQIPPALNVPPSLKMLGVSPQKRSLQTALQRQQAIILNTKEINELQQEQQPEHIQQTTTTTNNNNNNNNVGFENVLPLFNVQHVKPTTFKPPIAHRFSSLRLLNQIQQQQQQQLLQQEQSKLPSNLQQKQDGGSIGGIINGNNNSIPPPTTLTKPANGVQIQTSISLTPDPLVFTQIGNQPLIQQHQQQQSPPPFNPINFLNPPIINQYSQLPQQTIQQQQQQQQQYHHQLYQQQQQLLRQQQQQQQQQYNQRQHYQQLQNHHHNNRAHYQNDRQQYQSAGFLVPPPQFNPYFPTNFIQQQQPPQQGHYTLATDPYQQNQHTFTKRRGDFINNGFRY